MTSFAVVPYDKRIHERFVFTTFLESVRESWPWYMVEEARLRADLALRLRQKRPGAVTAVAHVDGDPGELMGWACCVPSCNEVVYAYTKGTYRTEAAPPDTKEMMRRMKPRFEPRVATTLISKLGLDLTAPTVLRFWTVAAQEIARHDGYQLAPTKECR